MILVGCAGYGGKHRDYAQRFHGVEIQETFYNLPNLSHAQKWRNEMPKHFQFALKAPQIITHEDSSPTYRRLKNAPPPARMVHYGSFKDNRYIAAAWQQTAAFAAKLGAKVVVFQCPPSFGPDAQNLRRLDHFFAKIPRPPCKLALEVRGEAWTPEHIRPLVERYGILHAFDPLTQEGVPTTPFYYRLTGRTGFKYRFRRRDMDELMEKLLASGQTDGWVMFGNITMTDDARRFQQNLPKELQWNPRAKKGPAAPQKPKPAPAPAAEEGDDVFEDDWD